MTDVQQPARPLVDLGNLTISRLQTLGLQTGLDLTKLDGILEKLYEWAVDFPTLAAQWGIVVTMPEEG